MATINRPRAAWFLPDGNSRECRARGGKAVRAARDAGNVQEKRPSLVFRYRPQKGSSEVRGRSLLRLRGTVHAPGSPRA